MTAPAVATSLQQQVREEIRRACPLAQPVLGPELELHRHLGLGGGALRRLFRSLQQAFGTDFSALNIDDCAPAGETAFGALTCEIVPLRSYRRLSVGDVERAVASGRWTEVA